MPTSVRQNIALKDSPHTKSNQINGSATLLACRTYARTGISYASKSDFVIDGGCQLDIMGRLLRPHYREEIPFLGICLTTQTYQTSTSEHSWRTSSYKLFQDVALSEAWKIPIRVVVEASTTIRCTNSKRNGRSRTPIAWHLSCTIQMPTIMRLHF